MSTEIKNTLFRFVSMRAPELTDDTKPHDGFVMRAASVRQGEFDTSVNTRTDEESKWDALKKAATRFSPMTKADIQKINQNLFDFSIWMAKNRQSFTEAELTAQNKELDAITDAAILGNIWDNLFYQIVTQKDFYAKEALIQLLIANHFVSLYKSEGIEKAKALLGAKVVLPKSLFVEDASTEGTPNTESSTSKLLERFPSAEMAKLQMTGQAELHNEELALLSEELQRVKTIYNNEYKVARTAAEKEHALRIRELKLDYDKRLEAENLKWCSTKPDGVTYDPNDPCSRPNSVSEPLYPDFNFSFRKELDYDFLASKLSTESLAVLVELIGAETTTDPGGNIEAERVTLSDPTTFAEDYAGFAELETQVETVVSKNNAIIANETLEEDTALVRIGGVIVPVGKTSVGADFSFQLCPKPLKINAVGATATRFNVDMSISLPNANWQVANIDYRLERTDGDYTNNGAQTYSTSVVGNRLYIKNMAIGNPTLADNSKLVGLSGTILFTNGVETTFELSRFNLSQCFTGELKGDLPVIDGALPQEAPFIPHGFGMKQLGIADYNKVEQTTQGYVEGDVAHIENIMAREFKERSTRRLRRKEDSVTTSTETEREELTDTTSTSRFEMHNEVANVIQNIKDMSAGTSFNAAYGTGDNNIQMGANANFATHNSKEESTAQAVTNAQEITERALDRIVTKVKEERVEKIVEEFEENNSHGFDNRKGDEHVVGVYRWVDKVLKNQVINYGKRLMFEFMVPQPAKLHVLGMSTLNTPQESMLIPPKDPRTYNVNKVKDASQVTEEKLKYWAGMYNVALPVKPKSNITLSKAFKLDFMSNDGQQGSSVNDSVEITEGYEAISFKMAGSVYSHQTDDDNGAFITVTVGDFQTGRHLSGTYNMAETLNAPVKDALAVSASSFDTMTASFNVTVACSLTDEAIKEWKQTAFNAIIEAYEDALEAHNEKLVEEQANVAEIKKTNPGFYREFENKILRKNCISYLMDQNTNALNTYGKSGLFRKNDSADVFTFGNTEVKVDATLDKYTAFVKFMEQAFEWDIMSYNLYPFYWGDRKDWTDLYTYDDTTDPLFRNFMQAGMARVVVTVRPGFEEAVRYYMQTGQIWNGGEVPVIEDELYLSLVEELRQPKGEKLGKAWPTRVPTALTILQAQSIGLKVTKALPFNEDLSDFETPDEVPQSEQLVLNEAELGGATTGTAAVGGNIKGTEGIQAKILLRRVDGFIQDMSYSDGEGTWKINDIPEGRYELLLDADDDFPANQFAVISGFKQQMVELENGQLREVNLELKRL